MKSNTENKNAGKTGQDDLFVLVWKEQFTLLEGLILKVLREHNGCSDEQIAGRLCLEKSEVSYILKGDGLKDVVAGDESHRELVSDFTGKVGQVLDSKGKEVSDFDLTRLSQENLDDFDRLAKKISHTEVSKELRNKKAEAYYKYTKELARKYPSPEEE